MVVPAAVLAELYRGGTNDQEVDACLGRFSGIEVVPTDRVLARLVGNILARAGRGRADHVDSTVVATALSHAPAVIATGDTGDISALAGDLPGISIQPV